MLTTNTCSHSIRGVGYNRSRHHEEWINKGMTLPDGRYVSWTVDEQHPKGPTIIIVRVDESPVFQPEGRDLLRAAGHPDGELRAMHDP